METAGASKLDVGRIGAAKIERKVIISKDQFGKKIIAPRLRNSLPATSVDGGMIVKQEEG